MVAIFTELGPASDARPRAPPPARARAHLSRAGASTMPEVGGVGLLAGPVRRRDLVPLALRAAARPRLPVGGHRTEPGELEHAELARRPAPRLIFIASFSAIFILLGLTAVGARPARCTRTRTRSTDIAGVLIIAMGVIFVARLFVDRLNREWHVDALMERAGRGGPLIAGAAFAIAWTPCLGPTLGAILTLAAASSERCRGRVPARRLLAGPGDPVPADGDRVHPDDDRLRASSSATTRRSWRPAASS